MKKILILLISLLLVTGCNSDKKQILTCTLEDKNDDFTMIQKTESEFISNKIEKATISIKYIVKDDSMLKSVKEAAKKSFDSFTNYKGINSEEKVSGLEYTYKLNIDVKNISDNVRASLNLTDDEYLKMYDNLTGSGYTCK